MTQQQVYATDAERKEARRATWRRNRRNQYQLYKSLCAEFDIAPDQKWATHLSEIRHLRSMPAPNRVLWRQLWAQGKRHQCWWLERHSIDEIRELACGW